MAIQKMEHTITRVTVFSVFFLATEEFSRGFISVRYPRIKPVPVPAMDPSAITMKMENTSVLTSGPHSCGYPFSDIKERMFSSLVIFFRIIRSGLKDNSERVPLIKTNVCDRTILTGFNETS